MTEPKKFRKKPVVVEARQLGRDYDEDVAIMQWCHGRFRPDPHDDADDAALFLIDTPEGPHIARSGDWIIRGVKGEFYPCKPDIFAATYEEVRDEPN